MRPVTYLLLALWSASSISLDLSEPVKDTSKAVNVKAALNAIGGISGPMYTGIEPLTFSFLDQSEIPDSIDSISYNYGDGNSGTAHTYTYEKAGAYTAQLNGRDKSGNSFSLQFKVVVEEDPIKCNFVNNGDNNRSFAKSFPVDGSVSVVDYFWDGLYIGRSDGMQPVVFNEHVYSVGKEKDSSFGSQTLYEVCKEPSWRYSN